MSKLLAILGWGAVAVVGALAVGAIAVHRGEPINALWLVVAATCCYALGYRFYSKFIAVKILADGFEYDGKTYDSLSSIASSVTGTRWNGFSFFGLNKKGAA